MPSGSTGVVFDGEMEDETCSVVEGEDWEALGWKEKDPPSIVGWTPMEDNAPAASFGLKLASGATPTEVSRELFAVMDECDASGCRSASPYGDVAEGSREPCWLDGAQLRRLKSLRRLDFTDSGGTEIPRSTALSGSPRSSKLGSTVVAGRFPLIKVDNRFRGAPLLLGVLLRGTGAAVSRCGLGASAVDNSR